MLSWQVDVGIEERGVKMEPTLCCVGAEAFDRQCPQSWQCVLALLAGNVDV